MPNDTLISVARWAARRLPMRHTIWLKRLRCEELPWQRRQRRLRALSTSSIEETFRHRANLYTRILQGYDAEAAVKHNTERVRDALHSHQIEHVVLPRITPFRPILAIHDRDTRATLRALEARREAEGWTILVKKNEAKQHVLRIEVTRHIVGPSGYQMSTPHERVVIEPWYEPDIDEQRADGSTHLPGTLQRRSGRRGALLEYLTPHSWQALARGEEVLFSIETPHLYQMTEPIDLVYTWVDGNDPAWQARKRHAEGLIDEHTLNETALSASRFHNHDELKYSLRSVEAYANWVNHIYIVTDGQVPSWLDTSHPKITVVDHREIFADSSVLPVFNSHAIESQLHHIAGLSEHYLYMNDDLFFMRPVRPERFFTSNGMSKYFASRAPLDVDEVTARDLPVLAAAKNGRDFVRREHGRIVTNKFKHTPHPQLRSVLQQMESEHRELFHRVAASKFRDPSDVSIASSLAHFHAYALGRAVPGSIAYDYLDISSERGPLRLEWFAYQGKLEVICLNDTHIEESEQDEVSRMLAEFLERRFSVVSSFER